MITCKNITKTYYSAAGDATVLKIKKHCPRNSEKERVKNLKNTGLVDKVIK